MPEEIWKDVPGYEGLYKVSNWGRLVNKSYRIRRQKLGIHGYLLINISKDDHPKFFRSHRIIALAHVPNPDNKPDVNHKNGIKHHNFAWNLEWVTKSENSKHSTHVLKKTKGQFKPDDRKIICETTGIIYQSIYEAAKDFNTNKNILWYHIYHHNGFLKRYALQFSFYDENKKYTQTRMTLELFIRIELFKRRLTFNKLAQRFNISGNHFRRCILGQSKISNSFLKKLQKELNIEYDQLLKLL